MVWRDVIIRIETVLRNKIVQWGVESVSQTEVSGEWVEEQIVAYADEVEHEVDLELIQLDGTYIAPDRVPSFFDTLLSLFIYRPSRYDCEDYAMTYKVLHALFTGVNTIGVVIDWYGGHAYNIVVLDTGDVVLFEPQTGEDVAPGQEEKYGFEKVEILI